tara:strand:+ start:116 stop:496 length:381 start_codon:yes stop_codon:yes gene_type:complete
MGHRHLSAEYQRKREAINRRVGAHISTSCDVLYAAYDTDTNGMPVDNLEEHPLPCGKYIFIKYGFCSGVDYVSKPVSNPTWLDIAAEANAAILFTGEFDIVILEGIIRTGDQLDGMEVVSIEMGGI